MTGGPESHCNTGGNAPAYDLGRMPHARTADENFSVMGSAVLSREPMKGFHPNILSRWHNDVLERVACRRLTRWCKRVAAMTDEEFATRLQLAVIAGSASKDIDDPLDWLYRAMREAAGKAGPLRTGAYRDHTTVHAQPFHARLVAAIRQLPPEQYGLLALFMWGARCEELAERQATSQDAVAKRIDQIARDLASTVFRTKP